MQERATRAAASARANKHLSRNHLREVSLRLSRVLLQHSSHHHLRALHLRAVSFRLSRVLLQHSSHHHLRPVGPFSILPRAPPHSQDATARSLRVV